jgi:pimeloyl-ACP methyl ester carboxylesterase
MPVSARVGHRLLNGWVGGANDGTALVFHSGTPFPPVQWGSLDAAARDRGLRLITYARPGYSGSTRHPGRSVADAAGDTGAVLDELGIGKFMVLGHSGGGPHALACAALLPSRCEAALSLAGVAPFEADDLDWMAGMGDENVEEFTTVLKGEEILRPYLTAYAEHFSEVTAEDVEASLAGLISEVDSAALTGELAEMMARSMQRAAKDGIEGWIDDDLAFAKSWGFDLKVIRVPVGVWQGRHDRMVPFAHGEWLHSNIETSKSRLLDNEGHISLLTDRLGDIITDLVELAESVGQ